MTHAFYDETIYKMGTSRVDIQTGPFTLFNLSQPFLLPLSSFIFFSKSRDFLSRFQVAINSGIWLGSPNWCSPGIVGRGLTVRRSRVETRAMKSIEILEMSKYNPPQWFAQRVCSLTGMIDHDFWMILKDFNDFSMIFMIFHVFDPFFMFLKGSRQDQRLRKELFRGYFSVLKCIMRHNDKVEIG